MYLTKTSNSENISVDINYDEEDYLPKFQMSTPDDE